MSSLCQKLTDAGPFSFTDRIPIESIDTYESTLLGRIGSPMCCDPSPCFRSPSNLGEFLSVSERSRNGSETEENRDTRFVGSSGPEESSRGKDSSRSK